MTAENKAHKDPCPGCRPHTVCRTPSCGRLKENDLTKDRERFQFYHSRVDLYASVWARSAQSAQARLSADDPCWSEPENIVSNVRFIPEDAPCLVLGPQERW